ncbi:MAG TPA: hypothetical protein VEY92_01925 [Pseudoxanthomonas sp.]|nr:hypothetical protein [Pseudoxanthomonas sp.]
MKNEQIQLLVQLMDEKSYEATMASCAILHSVINAIASQPNVDRLQLSQDIIDHLRIAAEISSSSLVNRCATQMAETIGQSIAQ